ncbi:hypothetical protein [Paenibacillus sp. FSL L8-0709]|uniref:hypothetical protein n=1 Tax=Paenibacillus sp. FSL L8-0709 TaxID=2975312 RepID=UPI0030F8E238
MNKRFLTCIAVAILLGCAWYFDFGIYSAIVDGIAHCFNSAVNFATAGITENRQSAVWLVSSLLIIGALIQIANLVLERRLHKKY